MKASTGHKLVWGALRFFLGLAQIWLALTALALLLIVGVKSGTIAFASAATVATLISRLVYRGRAAPKLQGDKSD